MLGDYFVDVLAKGVAELVDTDGFHVSTSLNVR
jgi:hypothetical protein